MKKLLVAVFSASLSAAPATAEVQLGGELRFSLFRNSDRSENFKRVAASFQTDLTQAVGLQLDIAAAKYESLTSTAPSVGLHLTYALVAETTLGAFLTGEDRRTGNYLYYGVEVAHDFGQMTLEAYVAGIDVLNSPQSGTRLGIDVKFGLDGHADSSRITLRAGAHGSNDSTTRNGFAYIGADYRLNNGVFLSATAGRSDLGHTVAGLSATIAFGGGSTFARRDFRGAFPGY